MKTFIVLCMTICWALAASICQADLGDTLVRCTARYGEPMPGKDTWVPDSMGEASIVFQKQGYDIAVILVKGIVECEGLSKSDNTPLSDNEMKSILHADSAGLEWAKPADTIFGKTWIRTDGAVALCQSSKHLMLLESKSFKVRLLAKEAGNQQNK